MQKQKNKGRIFLLYSLLNEEDNQEKASGDTAQTI